MPRFIVDTIEDLNSVHAELADEQDSGLRMSFDRQVVHDLRTILYKNKMERAWLTIGRPVLLQGLRACVDVSSAELAASESGSRTDVGDKWTEMLGLKSHRDFNKFVRRVTDSTSEHIVPVAFVQLLAADEKVWAQFCTFVDNCAECYLVSNVDRKMLTAFSRVRSYPEVFAGMSKGMCWEDDDDSEECDDE